MAMTCANVGLKGAPWRTIMLHRLLPFGLVAPGVVPNRWSAMMIRRVATTLIVAAALGLSAASAHAGPCSVEIAQFGQAVRQSAGNPYAGPMAPQSIDAQLGYQPTPASLRRAQQRARAAFAATLARAKRLDARGNPACWQALTEARRMYNL
jgi:hypothetical protein